MRSLCSLRPCPLRAQPWLCVGSGRSLQLWAPAPAAPLGGEDKSPRLSGAQVEAEADERADGRARAAKRAPPLAAVPGGFLSLASLPTLAQLSSDGRGSGELAGAESSLPPAGSEALAQPPSDDSAEFCVLAFVEHGSGGPEAAGSAAQAGGGQGCGGAGGLLLAGCSDGRLFAFLVRLPSAGAGGGDGGEGSGAPAGAEASAALPSLSLLWARRMPPPPLGGAATSCAVASLAVCAAPKTSQSKLAVVDGAGRLWLFALLAPAQPAQLAVPAVAPAAARGGRARKPVVPKLKTILCAVPRAAVLRSCAACRGRSGCETLCVATGR